MNGSRKLISFTLVLFMVFCTVLVPKAFTGGIMAETWNAAESAAADQPAEETTIYGYTYYELDGEYSGFKMCQWSRFTNLNPGLMEDLGETPENIDNVPGAAEYVYTEGEEPMVYGYILYGSEYSQRFFSMKFEDVMDGNIDAMQYADYQVDDSTAVLDLAYDYSTGTMYMLALNSQTLSTELCKVDLETGVETHLGELKYVGETIENLQMYMAYNFVIDLDGNAYVLLTSSGAISNGGTTKILSLDLDTCECTLRFDTGVVDSLQQQGFCMDHTTGKIYWAKCNIVRIPAELYEIDLDEGTIINRGVTSDDEHYGRQMLGLFVPYFGNSTPTPPVTEPPTTPPVTETPTTPPVSEPPTTPPEIPDPPADNYATIVLRADNFWGDDSGYQMLIDANHNTFGSMFNPGSPLCSGNAPAGVYEEFEYKIPENADGNLNTQNIVCGGRDYVFVPAGTYDWVIVNPAPSEGTIYVAASGNIDGGADDFTFEAGKTYEFYVHAGEGHDRVDLTIDGEDYVPGTEPPTTPPVTEEPTPTPPVTDLPTTPLVTEEPTPTPPVTDPGTEPLVTDPGTEPPETDDPSVTDDPFVTDPGTEPTETPSNPPAPPTGAVSLIGLGVAAMLTGSGIVVFRRKRD